MSDAPQTWLGFVGAALLAGLAGVSSWLAARATAKPAAKSADASAQQVLFDGFTKLVEDLRADVAGARADLAEAKRENAAKVDALVGEVQTLTRHIFSLEDLMRAGGVEVPDHPPSVAQLLISRGVVVNLEERRKP